jgi:ribosomal protein L1
MAKLTKRQKAIKEQVQAGKAYGIEDAVNLLTACLQQNSKNLLMLLST